MNFRHQPFVFLTGSLILGILYGHLERLTLGVSLIVIMLSLMFWFLKKNAIWRRVAQFIAVQLGCFLLGSILYHLHSDGGSSLAKLTDGKAFTALVNVEEMNHSEKNWRKGLVAVHSLVGEDRFIPVNEKILVYFNSPAIRENDRLLIRLSVDSIQNNHNPGEFDMERYWRNKNVFAVGFLGMDDYLILSSPSQPFLQRWRKTIESFFQRTLSAYLAGDQLAVAKALILGDKSQLRPELKKSFSSAGAMHVLAVSGLHIGIIVQMLIFIFGRFPRFISRRWAMIFTLFVLWGYMGIIGFPASVVRAGLMFSFLVIGRLIGRFSSSLNLLAVSAFLMLTIDPMWVFDLGFQLSYLAMLGILLYYQPIVQLWYIKNKWLLKVWQGTSVGLAAQLFTLPFTLHYFHQFPNYFLFTNVGMMVFAGLILGLGLLLFSAGWVPLLGNLIGGFLGASLLSMIVFVEFIESLPWAVARGYSLTPMVVVAAYAVLLFARVSRVRKWGRYTLLSTVLILVFFVQFMRFQAMRHSEMVVFNSNQLVIALKSKNELICLFDAPDEKMKNVRVLMEGYQNQFPGTLHYLRIKKGVTTIRLNGNVIRILPQSNGVLFENESSEGVYFIRTQFGKAPLHAARVIDMPYLGDNQEHIALCKGAYRSPLHEDFRALKRTDVKTSLLDE